MGSRRSKDGLNFYTTGPGFVYSDFNKAGRVDPWRISRHFENARFLIINHYLREVVHGNRSSSSGFLRFQKLDFLPEFYTSANITKSAWEIKTNISFVGNTSLWLESTTQNQRSGVAFLRHLCHLVRIDMSTRRPIKFEKEAGLAKFRQSASMSSHPRFEFPATTDDAADDDGGGANRKRLSFAMNTIALPSDMDRNDHVNQSVSLRFCLDCASLAAVRGGILRDFTEDMSFYNAKSFSVWYVGELRVGDEVNVECWEDPQNVHVLYFLVRTRGKVVYRCIGEWYTGDAGKKLHTETFWKDFASPSSTSRGINSKL